eukprot:CAMPEP_0170294720 /NCGR_PEP_ID=MMETSP0116_2-20130129/47478_1 /TAXON_ID=400756 /ORGANISM="Durinskia baltica, Strain CSIRO CS-38" /LENGTH=110 /DNA_ID=CAMNT_0010546259 /DNA_START=142 /DNA_END=473 /DNA_ORIENTATION=+
MVRDQGGNNARHGWAMLRVGGIENPAGAEKRRDAPGPIRAAAGLAPLAPSRSLRVLGGGLRRKMASGGGRPKKCAARRGRLLSSPHGAERAEPLRDRSSQARQPVEVSGP